MERLVIWRGLDEWRAEAAHVRVDGDRMRAEGTQLGAAPDPYRLDYSLRTGPEFVTESLELSLLSGGTLRRLMLRRDREGTWTADDRPLVELDGALDCDLGLSPLTNAMPVLRHRMLEQGAEPHDFAMAWVAVPDLGVHRADQRYEPIDGRHVRFVALGSPFVAELEFGDDGLVVHYPSLAERV